MRKKITAVVLSFVMAVGSGIPAFANNDSLPQVGQEIYGFKVTGRGEYRAANAQTVAFEHIKSGATLVYIANDDKNLAFNISYKTPQLDESDRNHVFEHAILASSDKYPSTDIFFDLANKSYNTYVNASTNMTTTNYPVASMSEEQLKIMMDVYLSCMVAPGIMENENFFKREALNYTLDSPESDIELGGTVFSEDTGYLTNMGYGVLDGIVDSLYTGEAESNMIGQAVENYKILTYDNVKELYDLCYNFDNSIITLYGDLDYKEFLKFINDEYLSKYEDKNTDLSGYIGKESEPKFVEETVKIPAYEGDTVEDASVVTYAIDLSKYSYEDILRLSYLTTLLNSNSSYINQMLVEYDILGTFTSYVYNDSYKPFIVFELDNTNPDMMDMFATIVRRGLNTIVHYGMGSDYDNLLKNLAVSESLQQESGEFGVNSAINLSIYWAVTGKTDLFDLDTKVFDELRADKENIIMKNLAYRLLEPENSALNVAVPEPGLAEQIDSERRAYLDEMKAGMSDAQIQAMVKETEEYNKWNSEQIHNDNVSIAPEDLPEPEAYPDVNIKELGSVTNYSVENGKDIGMYYVAFDLSRIAKEDLYYLYIYNLLIANLDTDKYTKEEIAQELPAHLSSGSVGIGYSKYAESEEYVPVLEAVWYGEAQDYRGGLEFLLDILENSNFSDTETILQVMEGSLPGIDPSRTGDPISYVRTRGYSDVSEEYDLDVYLSSKEFYDFAVNICDKLEKGESEDVVKKLYETADKVVNKTNIRTSVIGNSEVVKNAEGVNNEVLNTLTEAVGEKQTYTFEEIADKTAYIAELPNQTSVIISGVTDDFKGEYIPFIYLINDRYTVPAIRFNNGAYSAGSGFKMFDDSACMYTYSYSDPNVGLTVDTFENMAEGFKDQTVTQEELEGYIVAAYSTLVAPEGEYTRASKAIDNAMYGIDADAITEYAHGIKNAKAEDMGKAMECIDKMIDNSCIVFIGNSEAINEDKDVFDAVVDMR